MSYTTIIYDHESGTVLDASDCSLYIVSPDTSELLSEGTQDMETFSPRESIRLSEVRSLVAAASILLTNAEVTPDPRMGGATDAYLLTLEDVENLREALAQAAER